ncbi:MAG: BrnT family toxin [Thermoanaerobaculia bacterium]
MNVNFEWDEDKAVSNLRKHGISFEEGATVFTDPLSLTISDPLHSQYETRYVDIGRSIEGRLLVVVYTEEESTIRLISCRQASRAERRIYEEAHP